MKYEFYLYILKGIIIQIKKKKYESIYFKNALAQLI